MGNYFGNSGKRCQWLAQSVAVMWGEVIEFGKHLNMDPARVFVPLDVDMGEK